MDLRFLKRCAELAERLINETLDQTG